MSRHSTGFFTVARLARLLIAALIATFTVLPTATASAEVGHCPPKPDRGGPWCSDPSDPTDTTDTTGPVVTASILQTPNPDGWYRGNVRVTFSCSDDVSEVTDCPSPYVFTDQGADQSHSVTVHDEAGNATTFDVTGINIDWDAPTITVDGDGIMTTRHFVTGTVTDNLSGANSVLVIFKNAVAGKSKAVHAELTCATSTSCTWSAAAPAGLPWTVRARATDNAWNTSERLDWTHFALKTPKALN